MTNCAIILSGVCGTLFFLMEGITYIFTSVWYHKHQCEDIFRIYGIVMGLLMILVALFTIPLCCNLNSKLSNFELKISIFSAIVCGIIAIIIGVYCWGLYVLLSHKGVSCRYLNNSTMWEILIVFQILSPIVTTMVVIIGLMSSCGGFMYSQLPYT